MGKYVKYKALSFLLHKTADYRLINGGITHQKQQLSEKFDTTQQ